MDDQEARNTGFYRRAEVPRESICLSCFRTVRADRRERLGDAENAHRSECANGMRIPNSLRNIATSH